MWANEQADEARFFLATLESFQTGRVTPLLKEELRCKIQSRRLSEGKAELSVNLGKEDIDSKVRSKVHMYMFLCLSVCDVRVSFSVLKLNIFTAYTALERFFSRLRRSRSDFKN